MGPALLLALTMLGAPGAATAGSCRPSGANGPAIGLVLSGGGARGAAHVGVLRVLEELKIPIGCIAGTSMGAVVGGFYAAGWSPDEIERELLAINWGELFRGQLPRRSLSFRRKEDDLRYIDLEAGLRNGGIEFPRGAAASPVLDFLLRSRTLQVAGIDDFDLLHVPFRAVASDLVSGEEVVLSHGELSRALRASMSIPGVFPPVEIGDLLLVDGGVVDNLPVEVARAMGADIVIAVDAGTPLRSRDQIGSLSGVAYQALSLAAQRRIDEQKRIADVVLEPDLTKIDLFNFPAMGDAVQSGEEATRAASERLRRLSDPQAFVPFLTRQRRATPAAETLRSLDVAGSERVDPRRLRGRIESRPGAPLDLVRLRQDLGRIVEIGEFERVDFEFSRREDGVDLAIRPHDNSWGPLYLRGGLNITDDLEGHNSFNLLVNVTRTSLNARGAEWRNEFQAGRTRRFFSELYQPLDFAGRWFIAPALEYYETVNDVFLDRKKFAEYSSQAFGGRLDAGLQLGQYGEVRFGVRRGRAKAKPSVGIPGLPNLDIAVGGLAARLTIDRLDSASVPSQGELLVVEAFRSEPVLGGDLRYDKLSGSYYHFANAGRHTLFLGLAGGTSYGGRLPAFDEFVLGGMLSLSGYSEGELQGKYFGVVRPGYLFRVFELPQTLGAAVYLGGWLEAGNVWQTAGAIGDDLIYTATLAAAADTRFGALYFGYGVADDGIGHYFFTLGQRF